MLLSPALIVLLVFIGGLTALSGAFIAHRLFDRLLAACRGRPGTSAASASPQQ